MIDLKKYFIKLISNYSPDRAFVQEAWTKIDLAYNLSSIII